MCRERTVSLIQASRDSVFRDSVLRDERINTTVFMPDSYRTARRRLLAGQTSLVMPV